jgi:hypothetical protein
VVNRQQAADRFAHDIINRMRGATFTPAAATMVKAEVDRRTQADNGPVEDVRDVLRGRQLEPAEALAIAEFAGAIVRKPYTQTLTREEAERFGLNMPDAPQSLAATYRQTNEERDAGRTPGDTDRDGLVPGPNGRRLPDQGVSITPRPLRRP